MDSPPEAGAGGERSTCLVFMPMLAGYEEIRASIARAISDGGASMLRLEEVLLDAEWQHWLIEVVPQATFVLADITDHNPFVMYEVGLAHSRGLATLLVVNEANPRVSATVLGTPFLAYNLADLPTFERILARRIREKSAERHDRRATDPGPFASDHQAYAHALALLERFTDETAAATDAVSFDEFVTRLRVAAARGDRLPGDAGDAPVSRYLLPRVLRHADDVAAMKAVNAWIDAAAGTPGRGRSAGR